MKLGSSCIWSCPQNALFLLATREIWVGTNASKSRIYPISVKHKDHAAFTVRPTDTLLDERGSCKDDRYGIEEGA
jgi:hypothetical protein